MENPWKVLRMEAPYVLDVDSSAIGMFNRHAKPEHCIQTDVLPEPFIGSKDAPIVLLNLNPGFDERACLTYTAGYTSDAWRKNVLHEPLDYPFYFLDTRFSHSGGAQWWKKKLREPIQLAGEHAVASNIVCIEYFPYPSRKFKLMPGLLDSQRYSFALAEQAIDRNAVIVLMRGRRLWENAVPRLLDYPRLFTLNSPQNVAISRKNCGEGFLHIEAILRSEGRTTES